MPKIIGTVTHIRVVNPVQKRLVALGVVLPMMCPMDFVVTYYQALIYILQTNPSIPVGNSTCLDMPYELPSQCPTENFPMSWLIFTLCAAGGAVGVCGCLCCLMIWRHRRRDHYAALAPVNHLPPPIAIN